MLVDMNRLDKRVKQLVEHHKKTERNGRLLFAGWYERNNRRGDVNLFEVFEDFPDPGAGKLDSFVFSSSARFPVKGSLRLTITSPSELRAAAAQNDATLSQILQSQDKEVIYPEEAEWDEAIQELIRIHSPRLTAQSGSHIRRYPRTTLPPLLRSPDR